MKLKAITAAMARQLIDAGDNVAISCHPFTVEGAKALLNRIEEVATLKNLCITPSELKREQQFGLANAAFLTKLHNLALGTGGEGAPGLNARIACAKHIFTAVDQRSLVSVDDIRSYRAHCVFGFGDRDFDNLFEMGDGRQVRDAMTELAKSSGSVAQVCQQFGWMDGDRPRERG